MTKISLVNTSLSFFGCIKAEGERKKNDVYRLLITDHDLPIIKMYSIRLYQLEQAVSNRREFLKNPNVRKWGFNQLSTTIRKSQGGFIVIANVQGEKFQSEICPLDTATMIYDILVEGELQEKRMIED